MTTGLWLASATACTACISALVLTVQRSVCNTNAIRLGQETSNDPTLIKQDSHDTSVPFSDAHRISRITGETLLLVFLAAGELFRHSALLSSHRNQETIYNVILNAALLASWLYILIVAILSRRHPLPDSWGWILNAHLFVFYSVATCAAIHTLWAFTLSHDSLPWSEGLPDMLRLVLLIDLVYMTGSSKRGAPFVDDHGRPVSEVGVSSIFGFFTFSWVTPLILHIRKTKVTDQDLPLLPPNFRGHNLYYIFGASRDRGLLYRLYRANRFAILVNIPVCLAASLMYYVPPYFMNQLLSLIQDWDNGKRHDAVMRDGFPLVVGLGMSHVLLATLVCQMWYWATSFTQVRIKSMLNIEIYRKTLRRKDISTRNTDGDKANTDSGKSAKDKSNNNEDDDISSTGQIVNLMSTDANRISTFCMWFFTIITMPTELFIGTYFLYYLLGPSCFLGMLVMVITLPINHYNSKIFSRTQNRLMEARDKRVNLMNEVLQGIRQIKFFAWETNWHNRIMAARIEELRHLKTTYLCDVLFAFIWQGAPLLVAIISFYSFTKIEGKELTAPIAFTAINVFDELRFAINSLPEVFVGLFEALTSARRIQSYLEQEEVETPAPLDPSKPVVIGFHDATIAWADPTKDKDTQDSSSSGNTRIENDTFILKDLNIEFPNNEFSLICGPTGSGKTLMMLSLLGEAPVLSGSMSCPRAPVADTVVDEYTTPKNIPEEHWILDHAVAYVSQTAWLQNASIRDNITFGLPFIEQRYRDTLLTCALDKDLSILEDGDMTEIGEKGITLSGGQKARVALARAVYSRAKNVLMDDVLSAVDAHTARHLFEACLTGPLMRNRTRILITHHVKLCLSACAYLVHIQDGKVDMVGSPNQLRQSDGLATILEDDKKDEEVVEKDSEQNTTTPVSEAFLQLGATGQKPKTLVAEEARATGSVKARLYRLYLGRVGGWLFWALLFAMVFGSRALDITASWWLKKWTQNDSHGAGAATTYYQSEIGATTFSPTMFSIFPITNSSSVDNSAEGVSILSSTNNDGHSVNYYLTIYCIITFSNLIIATGRFAVIFMGVLRASKSLYEDLLHRVFRAPLRFYDTTPVGRILNRFSKDFETIDSSIPNDFMNVLINVVVVASIVIAVSSVLPVFLIPMGLTTLASLMIARLFLPVSRELKRLDSTTRSPLFSHFTETIVGATTIRAFGATQQFLQELLKRVDANSRPYYYTWVTNRWSTIRFGLLGAVVNGTVAGAILMNLDKLDASAAGFALSFTLVFTIQTSWAIRRFTNVELSFNAVERVVEFMEMDQEAPAITDLRPPPKWPSEGAIKVQNLEVRYAEDLDPVLKDLSFMVNPSEKIGIVGRTGSGKSTLALSFFRFVEASKGSIEIDGINIKDIGTQDLRSSLTIIPQDPTLFSGTLRSNMDPFDQFSDSDIFTALRRVHLLPSEDQVVQEDTVNANVFQDLNTPVSESGKNFSQGQRQLLCLARALLKRTRIVLMDEATASVDFETDKAIQKTIATEFADCTILCIAHRLRTVIEYDRVLVLDQGVIVEYANPLELILNPESVFSKMCRNSGEFDSLLALAKSKHELVDVS